MSFKSLLHPAFVRRSMQVLAILILLGGLAQAPWSAQAAPLMATFTINTTADTNDANLGDGICADAGGNCSLRAAISQANATAGADIITLPAGTYQLTIANTGGVNEDSNARGDLDILDSLTINGAGSGSTIIQAGTTTSNGIDKVFGVNPYCSNGVNVTIQGVTIRYGRNTQPYMAADFSFTGGGVDWCGGTGAETFTLRNSVVSDNTNVYGYGGGLNIDSFSGYTGTVTIDNVTFQNNQTQSTVNDVNGGAINIYGHQPNVIIQNSTFLNNGTSTVFSGGAIYYRPGYGGSMQITNSTFSDNGSGNGGAIFLYPWQAGTTVTIQNSQIVNNAASVNGGGLFVSGAVVTSFPIQLINLLISGNTAGTYGGGVYVNVANTTLVNSRIVNNTAPSGGSGLYKTSYAGSSIATATRNWWGCSTGPSAGPCDTAVTAGGTLNFTPWFRDLLGASPSPLVVNQSTALTASFLTDSSGGAVDFGDLRRIIGLPVTWGATLGTLSGTQATVQASGTATGTFQATGAGTAVLYARVDNDNTTPVSSNVLVLTVSPANTTTTLASSANPSMIGQAVTFTANVAGYYGNTPTVPTGNVQFFDGATSLGTRAVDATGQATLTTAALTAGSHTITATYLGDANFNGNTSTGAVHTVNQAPAITSANNTTFTVGSAGTFTVTTSGFPTGAGMVISETGSLPSGVAFNDNGDGTATLAGTPATGTGGVYPITITASNGIAPDASQSFTLTVNEAPSITSANTTTFTATVAGTFTVTTTGFPTGASMSISEVGALPSGVTFTDNLDGTAALAGTPAAGTQGNYPFTITASNGVLPDATQSFTLVVQPDLRITSADNTTFVVDTLGSFTVTTAGVPTPSITRGGAALPSGVIFTDNGDGTGTLSGTPAAGTQGTYSITFTASNGVAPNYVQNFTLTVNLAPTVTSANNATFTVGSAGTFTVTTTGVPAPAIARGGAALPTGVNFVDNGNGTGTLSGTPAAGTGGVYNLTFTASNGIPPDDTQNFTLTVNEAPAITSPNNVTFAVGTTSSFTVTTTGYPVPAISEAGALPSGVAFVDNGNGTGTLSGTPAAGSQGSYPITFTASNGVSPNATQGFTLTVNVAPAITSADNTTFTIGGAGSFTVTTTGVPTPAISIPPGSLPAGVTFTDNGNGTAALAGTPAAGTNGTYPFVITASNGVLPNATQGFTLTVDLAATTTTITSDAPDPSAVGQAISVTFTVTSAAPGTPSGAVSVSDGVDSCSADAVVGSCSLTLTTAGARTLTASYAGNSSFDGSVSVGEPHTVDLASTTTTITADAPDPSQVGQAVTVNYTVAVVAPGTGTPTGNVTVTDGVDSCTGTVAAGSCTITFSSAGAKTLTATYAGDASFAGSASPAVGHAVNMASTTINITSDAPDPSVVGIPLPVTYTVTVVAPGSGTPTGTVTITDGVDNCTVPVATGTCSLTLTTVGGRLLTATYSGDVNYGGSTSIPVPHMVEGPPGVTLINSAADTGDGQVAENEHTTAAITQLLVVFNKDMNADTPGDLDDVLTVANYSLVQGASTVIPINGVITYNAATRTATLDVNGGAALPGGEYTLTVLGRIEDTLGVPIGTDFVRHFTVDTADPYIVSSGVAGQPGDLVITNGGAYSSHFTSFTVTYNEDVANAGGGAGIDDVANPFNYLLLRPGTNAAYDTATCQAFAANGNLPLGDDLRVPTGPVTYANNGGTGPFVATVTVNGGTALADGEYRLLVCGTTSIVDLAGNPLNGGADSVFDFSIFTPNSLPATGFAPGQTTLLPVQPLDKAYAATDMTLEIPALEQELPIVGVPAMKAGWDVTWLGRSAGWLNGTAFPTWAGNSVITAHVWDAQNQPGPFAGLKNLQYGDQVRVRAWGQVYTYEVRENFRVRPENIRKAMQPEELSWLTLVTCEDYQFLWNSYSGRRVVRAVLVDVK